jgi:hypothetical protein
MIRRSRLAGVALGTLVLAGLVWASNAPMTTRASSDAVLRLAWSARPERVETCREQSAEELAKVPAHMRQPLVCEGTTASYRLQVRHNDALIAERIVHGGGLRRDRRVYIFQELAVPSGDADLRVSLDRIESPDGTSRVIQGQAQGAVPPHLSLTRRVRFFSRRVVLVTYDPERRALIAVERNPN